MSIGPAMQGLDTRVVVFRVHQHEDAGMGAQRTKGTCGIRVLGLITGQHGHRGDSQGAGLAHPPL